MSARIGPNIVTDGLVSILDINNDKSFNVSNTILDIVNENNASNFVDITYDDNNPKNLSFNGSTSKIDWVDISWNNLNSLSFMLWIKPSVLNVNGGSIMGKTNFEWIFYQYSKDLKMVYWNNAGQHTNGMDWTYSNFFPDTNWVCFHYTWDGTTSTIYRNDNISSKVLKTSVDSSINKNSTDIVKIGGNVYAWGGQIKYWSGLLNNIYYYNRTLTDAEVRQNYNALKSRYL